MLDSLLHEVPVQPSEWHRTLLLSQAWLSFMNRAYNACVEGRKAELEMQHSHGHIQDVEELKTRQMNSWLWVRDQITEQLKAASRGNPSVQGNSVLALAGLARAVSIFVQQQSSSGTTESYQRNTEWLNVVADTLMVVLDGNYKAKGPTLVWCQQVSSATSTASSLLARSCCALSLSLLVPCLVTLDTDRIHNMAELLKQRIPGQTKAGSSAVVQTSCSLGLGLFLSKLYEEHFSDVCGKEGYLLMTTALDALENAAMTSELENTEGACLGLGLAVSSLCKESLVDSRVHVTNLHNKLMDMLNEQDDPDQKLQSLCFGVACVCVNAFHTGLLSADQAVECIHKIQNMTAKHLEACGISLSLGLLLHGLVLCGHGGVIQMARQHGHDWRNVLENKDASELQKLSALNGIMGLLGSEQGLFIVDSSSSVNVFSSTGGSIIKYLQQIVSAPEHVGLSSNSAWLLGHLYTASTSSAVTKTSVPSNYSYLSEGSILRLLFDFLDKAGKTGPHLSFSGKIVPVVLESLVSGPQVALPPVNWVSVLGPIMRANFREEAGQLCIRLALNQAQSSSSLSSYLSSLLSRAVFIGLGDLCKRELLENLSRLVYVISSPKLREFYEGTLSEPWRNGKDRSLWRAILEAHISVLNLKDPPASVIGWTITALEQMYNACNENTEDNCLRLLARCLALIPVEKLESILRDTQSVSTKSLVVRCQVVGDGKAPVKWLAPCIDDMLKTDISETKYNELLCCVVRAMIDSGAKIKCAEKQHWFLELIGQFKEALQHSSSQHKILVNCLTLLSMVCAAWCDVPILQGIGQLSTTEPSFQLTAEQCGSLESFLWLLPLTLSTLVKQEPWTQITGKVLDWLLSLREEHKINTNRVQQALIQDTIISLRETDTFKKTAVWTDVIARFHSK